MRRSLRRFRAHLYYLRRPILNFLPLFLLLVALLVAGSICFRHLYVDEDGNRLDYIHALYITYCLVFMEHLIDLPEHWVLQVFYFILPPLGLVVILDGFVRFGYHVLRRDEHETDWIRAMAKTYSNHVVLCGLGRVGLRVLQQLIRLGEDVVVLEKNSENHNIAFAKRNEIPVLIGNGREEGILDDLHVAQAKSIILATDDDLANLEMALDARQAKSDIRVVMRMFDQELASKIRDAFDIHSAFSTAAQAAPLFATSSSDRSINHSFYVGDRLLVVAELIVNPDSKLIGRKIQEIVAEQQVFFLTHGRNGTDTYCPGTDLEFQAGDRLTVQTEPKTLNLLHELNRDKKPY